MKSILLIIFCLIFYSFCFSLSENNYTDRVNEFSDDDMAMLLNMDISEPQFEEPSKFTIWFRQVGIFILNKCIDCKGWLNKKYVEYISKKENFK